MTVVSRSWRRDASWIILRKRFRYLLSGLGSCFSCGSLGPACLWRFYPSHPYCGRTLSDRKHQGDLVIHFVQPMGQQSDSNGNTTSKPDRKSTRLNSSHTVNSYAVFCFKKKKET